MRQISDEGRREIAKELREQFYCCRHAEEFTEGLYDVLDLGHCEPTHGGYPDLAERLADYVEPAPVTGSTSDGYHTFDEMRECNDIEERRKIANRLRGLDSKIGDRDTLSTAVDELRMAVCGNAAISPVEYSVRNLVGFALELADLIEGNQYGGTCRNVYPNNEDHHCDNGFRCSACGDTVEDCENYRVSGTWNYCQKCRAKVVG